MAKSHHSAGRGPTFTSARPLGSLLLLLEHLLSSLLFLPQHLPSHNMCVCVSVCVCFCGGSMCECAVVSSVVRRARAAVCCSARICAPSCIPAPSPVCVCVCVCVCVFVCV